MPRRARLDAELVRRGLARSRQDAADLVAAGSVLVRGQRATKSATAVAPDDPVVVESASDDFVSRGAHKLVSALDAFRPAGLTVAGRRALDAGASTGGFTDVLLREQVAHVVAVDVGYGQLAWRLRTDERVTVVDRTNVRTLTADDIGGSVDLVVADLSFISLTLVLPALTALTADGADIVPMVKPQFEVGRSQVGDGVVRDPELRLAAIEKVAACAEDLGWATAGITRSALPGPSGNVEFFLWLRRGAGGWDRERAREEVGL